MNSDIPVIISNSIEPEFEQENFKHCQLEHFNVEVVKNASYIIISTDYLDFLLNALRKIRQHNLPLVYLKPVFVILRTSIHREYIELLADKVVDTKEFPSNRTRLENLAEDINNRMKKIPHFSTKTDSNLAVKILRFLYIRNSQLVPLRSCYSCFGYSYPNIDPFFNRADKRIFKLLKFFEDHALVSYEFTDRIFNCSSCLSAFINFREICPKCKSADLIAKEMIHHFRCAYVGPLDDFIQGDDLICPKCKKTLKIIGNDYEKPSNINICQNCANRFQTPLIETICYNCGKINDPDDLIQNVVKKYSLLDLAENVVLYGIESHFQHVLEGKLDLIKFGVFKKFLNLERNRIKRFKEFVSTLSLLHIKHLDKIYIDLGEKGRRLFQELSHLVKEELSDTDLITSYNDSMFCILFNNTIPEDADITLDKIKQNVLKLISHNLKYEIDIITSSTFVDGSKDADTLLKEMMQDGVD